MLRKKPGSGESWSVTGWTGVQSCGVALPYLTTDMITDISKIGDIVGQVRADKVRFIDTLLVATSSQERSVHATTHP